MLFHDEVRPTKGIPTGGKKPSKKQVDNAAAILEELSTDRQRERYQDCYREREDEGERGQDRRGKSTGGQNGRGKSTPRNGSKSAR